MQVRCPKCAHTFAVSESRIKSSVLCPHCENRFLVATHIEVTEEDEYRLQDDDPHWKRLQAPLPPRDISNNEPAGNAYELDANDLDDGDFDGDDFDNNDFDGEHRKEKRAGRERRPLDWGVLPWGFGFPWSAGAIWQWVITSLLMTIALFAGYLITGGETSSNLLASEMIRLFALGIGVPLCLLIAVIVAIKALTILTVTAGGSKKIEDWPPTMAILESLLETLYLFFALGLSAAIGWAMGWLLPPLGSIFGATIAVFFLFPFLLLSSLESGSPVVPFSRPVIISFRNHFRAWLGFLGQVAALIAVSSAAIAMLFWAMRTNAFLPIGCILASAIMIYFRLLGRLGWHCLWVPDADEDAEEEEDPASDGSPGDEHRTGRLD
jgi:hypothetical protein